MALPELAQMEAFVAVARTLHFGRAAAQLHITQSAVSQRIRALEDHLDVVLFARTRREVRLSPAGAAFLRRVAPLLDDVWRAAEEAQGAAAGASGRLVVGYSGAVTVTPLLDVLEDVLAARPKVTLELQRLPLPEQLRGLRAGAIDLGCTFLPVPAAPSRGLRQVALRPMPLYAWTASDDRPPRGLDELRHRRWVLLSDRAEPGFADWMRGATGIDPVGALEVDALDAALDLVRRGLGVAVLPRGTFVPDGIKLHPVPGATAQLTALSAEHAGTAVRDAAWDLLVERCAA